MDIQGNPNSLRLVGVVMGIGSLLFTVAAFTTAYFRRIPPTDPLEQLLVIAGDPVGWTAQAILFPIAMAIIAASFALAAAALPATPAKTVAILAAVLSAIACLVWIPISISRLQLLGAAPALIASFDASSPPQVMSGDRGWFWAYTIVTLVSMILIGAALALGGALPRLGWIVAGLAALSLLVVAPFVMRDWPPFMSYLFTLAMAIGLLRSHAS